MVVQRKTPATDGYDAVQLGLVEFARKRNKPITGHLKKAGADGVKYLREFRLRPGMGDPKPGDKVLVDQFKPAEKVDVTAPARARGFAGVVKRHHFGGGDNDARFDVPPRAGFDRRIELSLARFPGMRMAGHMGDEQVTVRNLEVVEIDLEDNLLLVKGAVPGPNGSYVIVRRAKR